MKINGLQLPEIFVRAIRSGLLKRKIGSWPLRTNCDAFGQPLETELGEVYDTPQTIARETAELPAGFEPNSEYGESAAEMAGPGAIPDIVDFSGIICFGSSGDGAPFCFDFRGGKASPRIIWWDDVYWRVIAPDFANFLSLFELPAGISRLRPPRR